MLRSSIVPALTVAAALTALAGCAPDTLPPPEGSAASATPTTGGPVDGRPGPDFQSGTNGSSDNGLIHYVCNDGSRINARYPDTDHAVVHYQGKKLAMHIAMSADGARYVGAHYEWWTRGSGRNAEATLYTHADDGSSGHQITSCREQ
ncbi:MliC family protein [Salinisphaera hydrothermalis]|uniref:MliC family protein n=1 Tax=Salinisphaera hydrothermalis TaxID=563188 RepID=UPI0012EB75CC|nr:MliC family protein [Salinisphaera hydrothermalis]